MVRRIAFTILAFALGSFGVSRVGGLPAKIAVGGAIAWAQDSTPADDAAQDDSGGDVVPLKKTPPPNVAGPWSGPIEDNDLGRGTISLEVNQKGGNLSGTWSDTLGLSGTFKGKIKGDAITATLKEKGAKCKGKWVGTLVTPDEVTGTYSIFGCKVSDGGTFDICTPACL